MPTQAMRLGFGYPIVLTGASCAVVSQAVLSLLLQTGLLVILLVEVDYFNELLLELKYRWFLSFLLFLRVIYFIYLSTL